VPLPVWLKKEACLLKGLPVPDAGENIVKRFSLYGMRKRDVCCYERDAEIVTEFHDRSFK
jgi:hypothetical protein